jgi:hypothetical protein
VKIVRLYLDGLDRQLVALDLDLEQSAASVLWAAAVEVLVGFRGVSARTALGLSAEIGDFDARQLSTGHFVRFRPAHLTVTVVVASATVARLQRRPHDQRSRHLVGRARPSRLG